MGKIGVDKILHFGMCFMLTLFVALPFVGLSTWYDAGIPDWVCASVGGAIAFFAGFTKEVIDKAQGKKFDFNDLLADFIGVAVAFICCLLL